MTSGTDRVERRRFDATPDAVPAARRCLVILDNICDRWGVHVVRDRKCVWCERDLSDSSGSGGS